MEVSERIRLIRMLEKINEYQEFSKKIGVKIISYFENKMKENDVPNIRSV